MITMNPVHLHGRSVWDQSYFPRDECEERVRIVRAEMARRGLRALLVFGHYTDYQDLCYLTQFFPAANWSLAFVPLEGDIILLPKLKGGRDLPAARARTWVQDVRNYRTLSEAIHEMLGEGVADGKIGLAGIEHSLPANLHDEVLACLASVSYVSVEKMLAEIRRSLRPREISALRRAAHIVKMAAGVLERAHAEGASNTEAVVAADGEARRLGAVDFRALAVLDESGALAPVEGLSTLRSEPFVAYLAANFLGYWADLAVTVGATAASLRDAESALRAMVRTAHAGIEANELAQAAADSLGQSRFNEARRYGLGNGIGLSLHSAPDVTLGNDEVLADNAVLSLRVRLADSTLSGVFISDLVLVGTSSSESLLGSA